MATLKAVIDTETTGLNPLFHEMIEISILPCEDDWAPHKTIAPFFARVKAKFPERMLPEVKAINHLDPTEGEEPLAVKERLDHWLALTGFKQLQPLGCNWTFDRTFILVFYPRFDQTAFGRIVHDVRRLAAALHEARGLYPRGTSLAKLAAAYGIDTSGAHASLVDCEITRKVYLAMLAELKG